MVNKRLFSAVERGHMGVVRSILDDDEELDNTQGYILLRTALKKKHSQIATLLLRKGCKVNRSLWGNSDTALHFAISSTDLGNVQLLLQKGAYINATNGCGDTPLHCACRRGKYGSAAIEIVRLLLSKNANVNCTNNRQYTPLHIAVDEGSFQAAEMLLNYGSNINSLCDKGQTPLHMASARCDAEASVKLLLQKGANVNAQDTYGKTALCYAVEKCYSNIVQVILSHCPDVNQDCNRRLVSIAVLGTGNESQYRTIIENLFQHGFSVTNEDVTDEVFYAAIAKGHLKVVEELLKLGAKVDCVQSSNTKGSPLYVAVSHKQSKITELLIRQGADVNYRNRQGEHLLFTAVQTRDYDITELLLGNKAKVSGKDAKKLLIEAVENCEKNIVQLLLEYQVFKDIVKESSEVINCAVSRQDSELVKLLLQYDANINRSEKETIPALHLAALTGHVEICKMLLRKGADISYLRTSMKNLTSSHFDLISATQLSYNLVSKRSRLPYTTALHVAAENGHGKVVKLLLKFGADIDCIDDKGYTALMIACRHCQLEIIQILLDSGSDINGMDSKLLCSPPGKRYHNNEHQKILFILSSHIHKMMCAGLFVPQAYIQISLLAQFEKGLFEEDLLNSFSQKFKAEIDVMKTEKVLSTCNTTFFDILARSTNQLAPLFKNGAFVQVLSSVDLQEKFPWYAGLISCNSKKAKLRATMLEKSTMFFHNHMPFLPHICRDEILCNLVNKDLEALYEAASP